MRIRKNSTTEKKFWAYVIKTNDGCWRWSNKLSAAGYPTINVKNSDGKWIPQYATRISWQLHHGAIPPGIEVCHKCDNPECTNPEHLFLGTHKENFEDMSRKMRAGVTSKINFDIAEMIRSEYTGRRGEQRELAEKYGLKQPSISAIIHHLQWKHPWPFATPKEH